MSGDVLKKVKSGDPLRISAQTFNAFIDVAKDYQGRKMHGGQFAQREFPQGGIVLVKNNTGADCDRFAVLAVDGPIFQPWSSLETFKNKVALKGIVPIEDTHSGNFVILQEPLKDGDIGSGLISGVCPVSIDVSNSTHKFADVAEGQTANLKSGPFGAAQILWKESGTGLKWAVVQMGLPAGYRDFVAKITNVGPNSEADFNTALYWVKEYYVAWNPNINPPGDPVVSQTMYLYEMPGGRHVPAYAMDEFGAYLQHSLPTDSTVAVIVHEMLSPAQNPPFYVFTGPSIIVAGA